MRTFCAILSHEQYDSLFQYALYTHNRLDYMQVPMHIDYHRIKEHERHMKLEDHGSNIKATVIHKWARRKLDTRLQNHDLDNVVCILDF